MIKQSTIQPGMAWNSNNTNRSGFVSWFRFFLISFGFSWTVWILMWCIEHRHSAPYKVAAMFGPAIACFLNRKYFDRDGFRDAGFGLPLKRYWFAAWLGFPLVSMLAMLITVSLGYGSWGSNPNPAISATAIIPAPAGLPDLSAAVIKSILDFTVNVLIIVPIVFGEDLGWGGWIIPKLLGHAGRLKTAWLFGFVWASWHIPIILMGHNNPDHTLIGAGVAFISTTIEGVSYAWLRIVSGSLWVVVLLHASLNSAFPWPFLWVKEASDGVWGIILFILFALLAASASIHLLIRPASASKS
jgi:membrane protease YdiL (CAAX protease family)